MRYVVPLFILMLSVPSVPVEAQESVNPSTFLTMDACADALQSGRVRFYEPRYYGLAARLPADGRERVVVALEADTCLEMFVVGGRRFVAQREGTLFRAFRLPDGSLSLYARNDCGNPVFNTVIPASSAPPVSLPVLPPVREPAGPPVIGPIAGTHEVMRAPAEKKRGFCSSMKCKLAFVAIGGAAAGYAVWRYWPCPEGTVHR